MSQLVWEERFNIGVPHLDKEHKKLFATMDKLLNLSQNEKTSTWVCKEGIKYLKNHVIGHFADEEEYMRSVGYEGYEVHKRLHNNFRTNTLPALELEMEQTGYSVEAMRHFLGVCIGWMTAHTLTEDRAMAGKAESKWDYVPPEEELSVVKDTVCYQLREMFHLDARVISEHYGGEDFGKSVYYRMSYLSQKGERWDITLVFEEKLLLDKVGAMLCCQFSRMDDVVLNATRYMSRQFLQRIRECLPTVDLHILQKESLLTREQFLKISEKEKPHSSILFDTGVGYFAFCANVPESVHGEIGHAIDAENAVEEIKRYLHKTSGPLKKILVVDDSDIVCHGMKRLLGADYRVALANSGASALKKIGMSKPDLILLDYEMPICDGRKTLEMIRAEQDTADIPVIFLTGRGDKDSVERVKSLRVSGYMLKTMKPQDIKKNIDLFFSQAEEGKTPLVI